MSAPPLPPAVLRLVSYLLDSADPDDPLLIDLPGWLVASPRFRAFAEANRDKIRKKVRGARTPGARLDLRAELRVAALLVADRRIELVFEAYGAGNRGPDFTATHRAGRPFNVEVTRRRLEDPDAPIAAPILDKLRQLPPSRSNVLVVALAGIPIAPDPGPTVRDLRARADRGYDAPWPVASRERPRSTPACDGSRRSSPGWRERRRGRGPASGRTAAPGSHSRSRRCGPSSGHCRVEGRRRQR